MACRRSQVRSLSGPPFETIRTRRKAGFLLCIPGVEWAFWRARRGIFARCWQARFAPLKAQEGALRCGLESQSKNAERRVFCCVLCAALAGAFRSVKSAGGRFAVRVRAAIKKRRKAGFLLCTFAQSAGAFRAVKSGKSVCTCNLPIKAAAVFYILCIWCVRFFKINFCFI